MDRSQLEPLCEISDGSPVALRLAVGLVKQGVHFDKVLEKLRSGADRFGILCADAYALLPESAKDTLHLICISRHSISGGALQHILREPRAVIEEDYLAHLRDMALIKEKEHASTWKDSRFSPANRLVQEYYSNSIRVNQPERDQRLRDAAAVYYYQKCQLNGYENWSGHDWIEENLGEVLNTLDWYNRTHQQHLFVRMMKSIYYFLGTRGYWRERLIYGDRAAQIARQQGDRRSEAEFLVRVIGWTEIQLCEYVKAREDIKRGLKMFEEVDDKGGCASACRYLGTIERREGNFDQASGFYRKAMDYAQLAVDNARLTAGIRVSLGTLYFKTGRLADCEQQLQEALSIFEKRGHKPRIAEVLSRLGDVRLKQGQIEDAESLYRRSEEYVEQINRPKTKAYNLLGLARIAQRRKEYEVASDYAELAREAFGNLGIADEATEMSDLLRLVGQ
jgi:tetratricopeptide (TPR) repeat protein